MLRGARVAFGCAYGARGGFGCACSNALRTMERARPQSRPRRGPPEHGQQMPKRRRLRGATAWSGMKPSDARPIHRTASAADDLVGLEARGADADLLDGARSDLRPHGLDVRVPTTMRPAMGVGDTHPEARALATNVTHGSHFGSTPIECDPTDRPGSKVTRITVVCAQAFTGNRPRIPTSGRAGQIAGETWSSGLCERSQLLAPSPAARVVSDSLAAYRERLMVKTSELSRRERTATR